LRRKKKGSKLEIASRTASRMSARGNSSLEESGKKFKPDKDFDSVIKEETRSAGRGEKRGKKV